MFCYSNATFLFHRRACTFVKATITISNLRTQACCYSLMKAVSYEYYFVAADP